MTVTRFVSLNATFAALLVMAGGSTIRAEEKPKPNYKEHVAPIFQSKCSACHNGDQKKGGLALDSFSGVMAGGGSGAVIEPGDSDASRLYMLVSHQEEPKMPPKSDRIPDADLALIKAWIDAGAPEASGSVVAMKAKPKLDFKLDPESVGKPIGPPAMPEKLTTEPVVTSARPNAITALATSPWAPLAAVAGFQQVLLFNTQTKHLCGVLPFPEGTIYCLKFSRDGGILLVGGGRGAEKGLAVAFDVKTGKRLFEVGKEFDVVLACDLSPDRTMVALGGPSKLLRAYNTADGELAYECKKHTDWVTAVAFSPDGALLASGDRNGGLVVWEAFTGREFHDLRNHSARITDLSWRLDSNVLASSSEDASIRLWEMENGGHVKGWSAHGGGAESVAFTKDGRIASTGRDRVTKLWDQNGAAQRQFEPFGDIGLRVALSFDDTVLIAGDWTGEVRLWKSADGRRLGNLTANPATIAARLDQAKQALSTAQAAAAKAAAELTAPQADATAKAAALTAAQQAQAASEAAAAKAAAEHAAAKKDHDGKAVVAKAKGDILAVFQNAEKQAQALKAAADAALKDAPEPIKPIAATSAASAAAQLHATAAALPGAKSTADQAATALAAAAKHAAELEPAAATTAKALEAAKAQVAAATAAKAASDQALAPKAAAAAATAAEVTALQAEIAALTAEKQASDAARVAAATPAK